MKNSEQYNELVKAVDNHITHTVYFGINILVTLSWLDGPKLNISIPSMGIASPALAKEYASFILEAATIANKIEEYIKKKQ